MFILHKFISLKKFIYIIINNMYYYYLFRYNMYNKLYLFNKYNLNKNNEKMIHSRRQLRNYINLKK